MKTIKYTLRYVVSAEGYIRARISWNSETLIFSTGLKITRHNAKGKTQWDGRRCTPGTLHTDKSFSASYINRHLESMEDDVNRAFYSFEQTDRIPTSKELKRILQPENDLPEDIDKLFLRFLRDGEKLHQWAFNTIKSIRQVWNLAKAYDPKIRITSINKKWFDGFIIYQQNHKLSTKNFKTSAGYANNVIQKNCRVLLWFFKWLSREGYIDAQMVRNLQPVLKTTHKTIVFLKWAELMKLYHATGLTETEQNAVDFFLFCAFTSLRYSDALRLTKKQVYGDIITITSQKTSDTLNIELNKYSRSILERHPEGDMALPRVPLCVLNRQLKRIGERLGIDAPVTVQQYYGAQRMERTVPKYELLSSHCARRTFICNALALGIAPNVVMKWTGHSEYSAMRPYIDIADEIKRDAMAKFDQL